MTAPQATAPGSAPAEEDCRRIAVADVPVGSGVIVQARNAVVTQPTAGEFMAYSSTCTHMMCQLSSVDGDKINCMCHNSQFSVADGSVLRGPATQALQPKGVSVVGDQIFIE